MRTISAGGRTKGQAHPGLLPFLHGRCGNAQKSVGASIASQKQRKEASMERQEVSWIRTATSGCAPMGAASMYRSPGWAAAASEHMDGISCRRQSTEDLAHTLTRALDEWIKLDSTAEETRSTLGTS